MNKVHPRRNQALKEMTDSDSDEGSCSGSDSEDESIFAVVKMANDEDVRIKIFVAFSCILSLEGESVLPTFSSRKGNAHRDRTQIIRLAGELDDKMFTRQFRLCREDFSSVLTKIEDDIKKDTSKATNSSESSISPQLMLMIALRILAGASCLDMIHYRVHVDLIASIV